MKRDDVDLRLTDTERPAKPLPSAESDRYHPLYASVARRAALTSQRFWSAADYIELALIACIGLGALAAIVIAG